MHVLLTNDDGPLDDVFCPYIKYLVDEIKVSTDWELSIVVPSQQRSWIGKAHFAGKTLNTTYIYTKVSTHSENLRINDFEGPFYSPEPTYVKDLGYQEWCLVDSTPAACADLGLHHIYAERKSSPIDIVISGPNFGKNSSNLYILTSGTVGAAMEAVTHDVKAIAISYAFLDLNHKYHVLKEAAKISVRLIKKLYKLLQEQKEIDLFSVNIPLIDSLDTKSTKVKFAPILRNSWNSIYTKSKELNELGQEQYKWNPDFKVVYKHGLSDSSHSDSRVLLEGGISVTPLKASFNVLEPLSGELTLNESDEDENDEIYNHEVSQLFQKLSIKSELDDRFEYAILVTFPENSYIFETISQCLEQLKGIFKITYDPSIIERLQHDSKLILFHLGEYEDFDIDSLNNTKRYFISSYIFRKALIRKHYLANTIRQFTAKHPLLILKTSFPQTYQIEVDYAEFLDDALDENYELRYEVENSDLTWILKPGMSDKGQGIRLFKSIDQLQRIFDSFEADYTSDDEDEESENNNVIISQLRHFVVQEYEEKPLLLPSYSNRKFHLRVYVVSVGNLRVSVYKNALALFSDVPYRQPLLNERDISMEGHLTNTCLQRNLLPLVVPFWDLKDEKFDEERKANVFDEICNVTKELFTAATSVDKINFQPLENALEVYGCDFLVTDDYSVTLLEVNAYPDFKQTGESLKHIIEDLFREILTKSLISLLVPTCKQSSDNLLVEVYDSTRV